MGAQAPLTLQIKRCMLWVLLPLVLGALSYGFLRPSTEAEILLRSLLGLNETSRHSPLYSFGWIGDIWADACWAFALYGALRLLAQIRQPWLALSAAVFYECVQLTEHVPGTFDVKDILAIAAAVVLAFVLMSHLEEGRSHDNK